MLRSLPDEIQEIVAAATSAVEYLEESNASLMRGLEQQRSQVERLQNDMLLYKNDDTTTTHPNLHHRGGGVGHNNKSADDNRSPASSEASSSAGGPPEVATSPRRRFFHQERGAAPASPDSKLLSASPRSLKTASAEKLTTIVQHLQQQLWALDEEKLGLLRQHEYEVAEAQRDVSEWRARAKQMEETAMRRSLELLQWKNRSKELKRQQQKQQNGTATTTPLIPPPIAPKTPTAATATKEAAAAVDNTDGTKKEPNQTQDQKKTQQQLTAAVVGVGLEAEVVKRDKKTIMFLSSELTKEHAGHQRQQKVTDRLREEIGIVKDELEFTRSAAKAQVESLQAFQQKITREGYSLTQLLWSCFACASLLLLLVWRAGC
jgi:hypothetical protein